MDFASRSDRCLSSAVMLFLGLVVVCASLARPIEGRANQSPRMKRQSQKHLGFESTLPQDYQRQSAAKASRLGQPAEYLQQQQQQMEQEQQHYQQPQLQTNNQGWAKTSKDVLTPGTRTYFRNRPTRMVGLPDEFSHHSSPDRDEVNPESATDAAGEPTAAREAGAQDTSETESADNAVGAGDSSKDDGGVVWGGVLGGGSGGSVYGEGSGRGDTPELTPEEQPMQSQEKTAHATTRSTAVATMPSSPPPQELPPPSPLHSKAVDGVDKNELERAKTLVQMKSSTPEKGMGPIEPAGALNSFPGMPSSETNKELLKYVDLDMQHEGGKRYQKTKGNSRIHRAHPHNASSPAKRAKPPPPPPPPPPHKTMPPTPMPTPQKPVDTKLQSTPRAPQQTATKADTATTTSTPAAVPIYSGFAAKQNRGFEAAMAEINTKYARTEDGGTAPTSKERGESSPVPIESNTRATHVRSTKKQKRKRSGGGLQRWLQWLLGVGFICFGAVHLRHGQRAKISQGAIAIGVLLVVYSTQ